jgi:hypothetical protein
VAAQVITVHGDSPYGPVEWRPGRDGLPARTCSYCGSLHPEDLVKLAEAGQLADVDRSVDWKYGWPHKVYVDVRNPKPGTLYVVGSSTHASETYRAYKDLTWAERRAVRRDDWHRKRRRRGGFLIGKRATLHAKFYNVHQAEADVTRELRLAVGRLTGYVIEPAEDGRIRWMAFDYETGRVGQP